VVSRTHYLPAFSRLGAYPRALLDEVAWGRKRPLFEYWAHEASLLPLSSQPLFRWRMQDAHDGAGVWKGVARFLRERRDFVDKVLEEITAATRRGTFERVYGLPEKVLPRAIVETPTPPRDEAQRALYRIAARAMGVAT